MIDEVLSKVVTQIPALATLVVLVVCFVRYLKSRDAVLKEISDRCHQTQEHSTAAVIGMTALLNEVKGLLLSNGRLRRE